MKKFFLIVFTITLVSQKCTAQELSEACRSKDTTLQGFVFINLSSIYNYNGSIIIVSLKNDTILQAEGKTILINGTIYKTIEDEYIYKKYINIEALDVEYGIFILKCYGITNGFYKVEMNGRIDLLIRNEISNKCIEFKDIQKYIMDTYPIPTVENPLRMNPDENSEEIKDFNEWTYIPIAIKGDWIKVIDNKNCYKGVSASSNDIIGWLRWKKNGIMILKVAHVC